MRHNSRRMKNNRSNNNNNSSNGPRRNSNVPPRMQVFDSNGPDVRIRGTAWQVHEKYLALAKDAAATGDVIVAENYLQHAEHYQRIINTFTEQMGSQWTPPSAINDDGSNNEGEVAMQVQTGNQQQVQQQTQQQQVQQQHNAAPRSDRRDDAGRDDLGLPSSLFKPTQPSAALETA